MSLLHYNKVFVLAPNKFASGGPELSHQLVDYLRNKGVDASIVYVTNPDEGCKEVPGSSIPKPYQKYNIAVDPAVEDISENVVIIPEAFLLAVPHYPHAQVCVWWMSVDVAIRWDNNFEDSYQLEQDKKKRRQLLRYAINDKLKDTFLWRIKCLLSGHAYIKPVKNFANRYSLSRLKIEDYRLYHFYQAVYIQQFLYQHKFDRLVRLTDYINPEIINNVDTSRKKENIILYNPEKGIEYTRKLMTLMPGYKFVALKGFTREQLNELFDRAKLYIDFGPFPGKDRLPREAAIHNCCVITGRFGASGYFEDVPIFGKYKFDMRNPDYTLIKNKIDDIFANYDACNKDFDYLRETIRHEQENFYREIDRIFIDK